MDVKHQDSTDKSTLVIDSDVEHHKTRSSDAVPSAAAGVLEDATNEYPSTKKMAVIMAGLMMTLFMMALVCTICNHQNLESIVV